MSLIFFSPFFVWYTIEILKIMIIISDDFKTWQDFDAKNNTREFVCVCVIVTLTDMVVKSC